MSAAELARLRMVNRGPARGGGDVTPDSELLRYLRWPSVLEAADWPDDEPEDVECDTRLALYDAYEASQDDADDADLRRLDDARDLGYRTVAEQRESEQEDAEADAREAEV